MASSKTFLKQTSLRKSPCLEASVYLCLAHPPTQSYLRSSSFFHFSLLLSLLKVFCIERSLVLWHCFLKPRRLIQITKYCLSSQVQYGMGEVWVRKISFDPLDPGCLLAIVSSRSPRDPTLRSRLSHHSLLSSSQMNVQILFNILEAPGCEFLLLRSLLFLQAGTCQEHRQPQR